MVEVNAESEMSEALSGIVMDDVLSRHRRERKDLQAKIQALKKSAPKNDKKKRKEIMEEVARMERDLEKKQASELVEAKKEQQNEQQNENTNEKQQNFDDALCNGDDEEDATGTTQRVTKAQKRRDKKAREARQREEDIRVAAEDSKFAPKAIERRAIQSKLLERQLTLHYIPSDGNCLYNAVRHQLAQKGLPTYSVQELRKETANYIRAHKDSLICYMTNPQTGFLLTDAEFENYCELLHTTPAWGGQIELKALSSILKVPIEVLQAEGPPTVQGADEFAGPSLLITYHRHMYSLGEHYNSSVPIVQV